MPNATKSMSNQTVFFPEAASTRTFLHQKLQDMALATEVYEQLDAL